MMKIQKFLPLCAFLCATFMLPRAANAASINVKQTQLTTITADQYLGTATGIGETLLVSPDCQHIAIVIKRGDEMGWQIDGKAEKYFSTLGPGQWSPDSAHFAYSMFDGDKWRMLIDGKPGATYAAVGFPIWSPDSSKLAYVANQRGKVLIVNGDQKSQLYDDVKDLQYSANGTLAAIAHDNGKDLLWINGKIQASTDEIAQFAWSKKGDHFAYAARDNSAWTVYHDDSAGKAVEKVQLLTISPDGEHVAYVATISGGAVVRLNSPNPSSSKSTSQILITDEKTIEIQNSPGYTYTGIIYSPDSQHLAWTAGYFGQIAVPNSLPPQAEQQIDSIEKTGMCVFVDGKSGPGFTNVSAPVWSPDSAHIAYGAIKLQMGNLTKYVVKDNTPSAAYSDVTQPVWNPTNNTIAFAAASDAPGDQQKSVVINAEKSSPEYETASDLRFSPDGKYFSYLAVDDKGVFANINGTDSPHFDGFMGNTKSYFDESGHLHAIAIKGQKSLKVFHIELSLQ